MYCLQGKISHEDEIQEGSSLFEKTQSKGYVQYKP